jgi:hypothetical protein
MKHLLNFPTYLIIRLLQLPLFWRSVLSYSKHTFLAHDYFIAVFGYGAIFFSWHLLWIGFLTYCAFVFYEVYKDYMLNEKLKDQDYGN